MDPIDIGQMLHFAQLSCALREWVRLTHYQYGLIYKAFLARQQSF